MPTSAGPPIPVLYDLSEEPHTVCRLNVNAFQQSALTSFRGYQYCAFYRAYSTDERHVVLGRRKITSGAEWEFLELDDYKQTTDDGHNTISIGICRSDGTLHISFDHHSDDLKYRVSNIGVTSEPEKFSWEPSLFSPVLNRLDKNVNSNRLPVLQQVTYPRFVNVGEGLLFEYRVGKAGAGSDVLYSYNPQKQGFDLIGTYLIGVNSNPYPNGLTYDHTIGRVHVSWTNRHFTDYEGANDPNSTAHKAQAGPNGPENNENLCYASSDDRGNSWKLPLTSKSIAATQGIIGTDPSAVAIAIPRDSGIMNQEAQCIDTQGGFHVLNRDDRDDGIERWRHYHLAADGCWRTTTLPFRQPTKLSARGKLIYDQESDSMYFLLPPVGNEKSDGLVVIRAQRQADGSFSSGHEMIWLGTEYEGEVLVDEQAVQEMGILFILTVKRMPSGKRRVVILEFLLHDLDPSPKIQ